MLFFGDRSCTVDPRSALARRAARLARARVLAGEAREEQLLSSLVEAGELAQGLADEAFGAHGCDDDQHGAASAALSLTLEIARAWLSAAGRGDDVSWPNPARVLATPLPASVRTNVPEGYAHYALYPVLYAEAARRMRRTHDRWFVIGLRSIGTSLAAVVAVACGAGDLATLRPVGHPHQRTLRIGAALERRLRAAIAAGATFAVVDEGPGLSGSSFASVVDWLADARAEPRQVVLLPAHLGPLGSAAPGSRRAWWDRAERHVCTFEEVVLPRLAASVERSSGPGALQDVGGGKWRAAIPRAGSAVPPGFAMLERRKYHAGGTGSRQLLRFAGVGPYAERALERARALADAGWAPPPRAPFPGFLATEIAPPAPCPRAALPTRSELASYLAHRAGAFRAGDGDGATPDQLMEMVRVNAREALGVEAERTVERFAPAARASAALPRVAIDGKLEWWEWTRSPQGRAWKLDGTDHAFGHDLVGCQPVTWDVAGARIELGLSGPAALELARSIVPGASAAVLAFHEAAYLAHRIGRWTFALQQERDDAERDRIARTLRRYSERLRRRL